MSLNSLHITVEVVEALVEHLRQQNVDVDALLNSVGLSMDACSEEGFMDFNAFCALFEAAGQAAADPYIGLHVGEGFLARHWGRLGYLIISGSDGFEGLQYLQRFAKIVTNALSLKLEWVGGLVRCTFSVAATQPSRQIIDYFIASALALSSMMTQGAFRFQKVQFQHALQGDLSVYESAFKAPCEFGAEENCITVEASQFAPASLYRDPRLKKILEEHAVSVLQRLKSDDEWLKQVRSFVIEALPNGLPSLKQTAEHFGQNERTFQRALSRLGVNFQELIDELRMNLALEYMRNDYGLLDVALMLGYSEQSAFHRAFKRWMGVPPSRYKKDVMKN